MTILTPERLREHAQAPETAFWADEARALLKWAADLLEAAEAAMRADEKLRAEILRARRNGSPPEAYWLADSATVGQEQK